MPYRMSATADELRLASFVARNVQLLRVFLVHATGSRKSELPDDARCVSPLSWFEVREGTARRLDARRLLVEVGTRVHYEAGKADTIQPKKDASSPLDGADVFVEVIYAAEYQLPEGDAPSDVEEKGFRAFARTNGTLNCWPYIRQEVDRISSNLGVRLTLPLLMIAPEKAPAVDAATSAPSNVRTRAKR
jgi:hypothetical protein